MDPSQALSREEFVDDLALTSMARLWDVGKSEPIKGEAAWSRLRCVINCKHASLSS